MNRMMWKADINNTTVFTVSTITMGYETTLNVM